VECKLRASQCRRERYAERILIEGDPTRDLQFLISEHRGSSGMVRQCLKLLLRETAPISGVLPRANDIRAGLCWGVDKSFHEALLSMCVAQLKCCACAGETVKENPALIERCCGWRSILELLDSGIFTAETDKKSNRCVECGSTMHVQAVSGSGVTHSEQRIESPRT
jgi:hypothetical protein